MHKHVGGRWLVTLAIAIMVAIAAAACGSAGSKDFGPGQADASDTTDGAAVFSIGADGGTVCIPKTCTQLGYDCGRNGDGCGGSLNCGGCGSGRVFWGGRGWRSGGRKGGGPRGAVGF